MQVGFGDHLRVVGNIEELGAWDVWQAPCLEWHEGEGRWRSCRALPLVCVDRSLGTEWGCDWRRWEC